MTNPDTLRKRLRLLTWVIIVGLAISGLTAIPLQWELDLVCRMFGAEAGSTGLNGWLVRIRDGLNVTYGQYPFIGYGTDWLAFGHIVIAIAFVGVLRDPIRNQWLFQFGLIACVLVIPYAFGMGQVRGIPIYWRLIDCSFGVCGFVPLWLCRKYVRELEAQHQSSK